MGCEAWRAELDRYVDGELSPEGSGDLALHLKGCSACASEVLARVQLKRAVHSAGKRYVASKGLRTRIAARVTSKIPAGINWNWKPALIPGLALLIATLLLGLYIVRQRGAELQVFGELTDLHVATLASSTPVDVVSTDRHTVKPWFQGKIPFTFNLPELTGTDFTLLGGRVFYLHQTAGAHLIFQLRKHEISLFIQPEQAEASSNLGSQATTSATFHLDSWTQDGLRYFLVADVNAEDLRTLEKLLRNAR